MTAHVSMARVPFAQLDNPRLQHLASAKNKQNGVIAQKSALNSKSNLISPKSLLSKRAFEPCICEDVDSENIDPATLNLPSKKTKSDVFDYPVKAFAFSPSSSISMPPPSSMSPRAHTPARAYTPSLRTPMTAPAGRSPPRKIAGVGKTRRVSAPFTRIDPPFSSHNSCALPFSLDAALSGTLSSAARSSTSTGATATIQESMPKNWFFEIYEDTPGEEAANLMEHSTLTLDLSSDEEGVKKGRDGRGKENMPPEGYDGSAASRFVAESSSTASNDIKTIEVIRKKIFTDEMDDGQRSPLSDLETAPFIPEALIGDSHVALQPAPERASSMAPFDTRNLCTTPLPATSTSILEPDMMSSAVKVFDLPAISTDKGLTGDIVV